MTSNRSLPAALALTLSLALTACGSGDDEPVPAPTGSAAATEAGQEATATATQDPGETATESPAGTQEPSGDDEDEAEDTAGGTDDGAATGEATEADDDTDDDGEDDDSDGVVGGGPAADLTPSALAAVESALGDVDGTAYRVDDREDGFWEVDVMTADGASQVTVAPDGTTVDGVADATDDPLDDAGRKALAGAQVTLAEAVVAAVRASQGQLDSAELASVDGAWWWRVVVDSASEQDVELRVDPATGEVVASAG